MGVNRYENGEESPLPSGAEAIVEIDQSAEAEQTARLEAWRNDRDDAAVAEALEELRAACESDKNVMPPSIKAGQGGRHDGRVGRRRPLGLRPVPRPDRRLDVAFQPDRRA